MTLNGITRSTLLQRAARTSATFAAAGLLAIAASSSGCAKHAGTMKPAATTQTETDPLNERVAELRMHADQLATVAVGLPGRTTEEHVTLMRESFDHISKILPLLYGSDEPGTFRQIVRTIETQRDTLASGGGGQNPEPTIDTGLRSTIDGLTALSQERLYTGAGVGQTIDQAREKLGELDTTRGAIHQLVAGQIVGQVNRAVSSMTRELTRRAATGTDEAPATGPTSGPAASPDATPADPANPADPAKPADPAAPTKPPATPDPAKPAAPADPAAPATPDPAAPADPAKPAEPAAPADPAAPAEPAKPADPAAPAEPPATPEPAAPADPAKPADRAPTPEPPAAPETPKAPETPEPPAAENPAPSDGNK